MKNQSPGKRPLSLREAYNFAKNTNEFLQSDTTPTQSNNFISENHELPTVINSSEKKQELYQSYLNAYETNSHFPN